MNKQKDAQAGFTLVEALVAIVILATGIVAVTNLMVYAASSNQIGSLTTATAAEASTTLDRLKSVDYFTLINPVTSTALQGSLAADTGAANATPSATTDIFVGGVLTYHMYRQVPGVGIIRSRWTIQPFNNGPTLYCLITVQSQAVTARLGGQLSQSQFATWRSCTSQGCP
ncbi:MAG: prepilin-type N-terminal cleavage/methylation domain-containing protein [Vicinamibacteria bacterium]